ncbi:hypothetical protein POKO110462_04025 [Pontibacter korlensis]|uniref:hypothetical protein n=1 Tax=Pontibacter korlensis TaxID=400092 RepID=UPI0006972DF8|nr:hypothetical protein [Pontibacter korlensis]
MRKFFRVTTMMFSAHPSISSACVRYFYLPATKERPAEVIEVINSNSNTVNVPMREEDLELQTFFVRPLCTREAEQYKGTETWKLFTSWEELQQDHYKLDLPNEILNQLLRFRQSFALQEEIAA